MLTKGFLKPPLSIDTLGKRNFVTGVSIGILSAIVLSLFFNYSRESLRVITILRDLYILPENESRWYDLFFASLSTSLGFGLSIIYWLIGKNKHIKKRYVKNFAISNSLLINIVVLLAVTRFGSILPLVLYGSYGYDGQLDLLHDFWLMLIMIPIFLFFAHWNSIRMIFRTRYWVLLSGICCLLASFLLCHTTRADRDILNHSYYLQNKEKFDYIDSEFDKAAKWGLFFNDTTKQILRKKYSERTTDLVLNLKLAFRSKKRIPLDTLILEKIVIHNLNSHGLYFNRGSRDRYDSFPYALPEDIYTQILKHEPADKETEVLFEILAEQLSLFAAPEIKWDEWGNYSDYEREKSNFKRTLMRSSETIPNQLIDVVNKLKSDNLYDKYHHLLNNVELLDNQIIVK